MPHDARKYLFDIQRACALLTDFTSGRTFAEYSSDPMLRSAIERQFEIVGEALGQLSKSHPETAGAITEYRRIIAFRNVLIHGYDVVSDEVVWGVVEGNLPTLSQEVEALLVKADTTVEEPPTDLGRS